MDKNLTLEGLKGLKDVLQNIIDERDKQYDIRFKASEASFKAALAAQKEAVATAFLASEKAIVKAEEAQSDYNHRSNDFRGQLDDQAKALMPRAEAMGLLRGIDDKFQFMQESFEGKLETLRVAADKNLEASTSTFSEIRLNMTHFLLADTYDSRHSELQRQVNDLREARSQEAGKNAGVDKTWGYIIGALGIIVAVITVVTRFIK